MNDVFSGIKCVGFDLDDTLYATDDRINDLIRNEVATLILEERRDLETVQRVRSIYDAVYEEEGSWTKILRKLKIDNPKDVMKEIVSNPKILDFIKRDDLLVGVLGKIARKYDIFLITNSPKEFSIQKLETIGIDPRMFGYISYGDDPGSTPKVNGRVFREFLEQSKHLPGEHVFVGDGLISDVIPASACGMKTIAVGSPIAQADYSIARIRDIEGLLL